MPKNIVSRIGSGLLSRAKTVPANTLMMGGMGALVGGISAATITGMKVTKGEMKKTEAAKTVIRETAGTGIATGAAAAATTALGLGGLPAIAGFVVVATLAKGVWDSAVADSSDRADESTALEKKNKTPAFD